MNQELENSISWKFGNHISHSFAVVTSPIDKYQQLGPLTEGKHDLTFRSPEECLEKTEILFRIDDLRLKMQGANPAYYKDWLHPGEKILKILQLIKE